MTHLYEKDWSREKLARYTGTLDQVAGIRLVEALEGVERGSRRLDVRPTTEAYQARGSSVLHSSQVGCVEAAIDEEGLRVQTLLKN